MLSPIRLIAIDVDGTLLDSHFQVSEQNLATLRMADSMGVEIVLATGRRHNFALPVAQALGFDAAIISSNGAITRSTDGSLFHRDPLPLAVTLELIAHMTDFRRNLVVTLEDQLGAANTGAQQTSDCPSAPTASETPTEGTGSLVLETLEELSVSIKRWLEKNACHLRFVRPIEQGLHTDPIQAMFCGTVERMVAAQEQLLKNRPLLSRITALKTQYDQRDLCMLDILTQGCSKGAALKRWATHKGYHPAEVMAIGDNYNDIEMLEFAGHAYLMGNSPEDLRHRGWQMTMGNDDNGVAAAIEAALNGLE